MLNSKYQNFANDIASEIVFSSSPGKTMRKWREIFSISQVQLSDYLGITSSTISDYESERRKNPGISIIRRFVYALIDIDLQRGGHTVNRYLNQSYSDDFYILHEFTTALNGAEFVNLIEGDVLINAELLSNVRVYGYTLVHSLRTILEMKSEDFPKLFGNAHDRAFIFTEVSTGRSPMVVVRSSTTKPTVVILHGLTMEGVDKLAIELAKKDHIPLVITNLPLEEILTRLNKL